MSAPIPDNAAAERFLDQWRPGGPWVLTAIRPDRKGITTTTFRDATRAKLREFLDQWNGNRNIYFHVNSTMRDLDKKAGREDIAALDWLHVDIDPRAGEDIEEERARIRELLTSNLPEGVPPPSVVVFSGGGYQAFWKLIEPVEIGGDLDKAEDAKLWNLDLERKFGGDNCHDICRIMRVPGSLNIPDARKRAKGRVLTLATPELFELDRVYHLNEFSKAAPSTSPSTTSTTSTPVAARLDETDLEKKGLDALAQKVIAQGTDPEDPNRWGGDRSAAVFFVCCAMVRAKFSDSEIVAVLSDPDWAISDHVLEQKRSGYAMRQALRARDEVENDFTTDEHGQPHKTQRNIRLAIRKLGVALRYNEFTCKHEIAGLPEHGPTLQDAAVTDMRLSIEENFRLTVGKERFGDIVDNVARRDRYNPIRDYLDGLTWDGVERLDGWLATYGGATDDRYTRAVGSIPLIAACRRARSPGCKFDEMLVFISGQGLNKSSAIKALLPDPQYFSDSLPLGARAQEVCEQISGKWIIEFAELHGMTAAKIERIKAFLSRQTDSARLGYGRIPEEFPRQCVFIGTTNTRKFMSDLTGGRRFWPVEVKMFDLGKLRADRDQLWAEAAHRERAGASIRLDPELYAVAEEHQEEHRVDNQFIPILSEALGKIEGKISSARVWMILNIPTAQRTQGHNDLMGEAMKALDWKRKRLRFSTSTKLEYGYRRGKGPRFPEIAIIKNRDGQWIAQAVDVVAALKQQLDVAIEQAAFEKAAEQALGDQYDRDN